MAGGGQMQNPYQQVGRGGRGGMRQMAGVNPNQPILQRLIGAMGPGAGMAPQPAFGQTNMYSTLPMPQPMPRQIGTMGPGAGMAPMQGQSVDEIRAIMTDPMPRQIGTMGPGAGMAPMQGQMPPGLERQVMPLTAQNPYSAMPQQGSQDLYAQLVRQQQLGIQPQMPNQQMLDAQRAMLMQQNQQQNPYAPYQQQMPQSANPRIQNLASQLQAQGLTQKQSLQAAQAGLNPQGGGMMPNLPGGTPLPNRGTLVGFGPTDAPIYSTDPNAKGYTGPYMGGQYFNNGLLVPPPQRMPQQPLPSLGAGIAALDPRMFA